MQEKEFWCFDCTTKRNSSMKKGKCEDCSNEYQCSAYYYEMKRSDFPTQCFHCRVAERAQKRYELDGWINVMQKQKIVPLGG